MTAPAPAQRIRDWLCVAAAILLGPAFQVVGYAGNLLFGAAAFFYFFVCACVIPLLVWNASRLRFAVWQLAVFSMMLSVVGDNLRLRAMHGRELVGVAYVFWVLGTLLSSPLPMYHLLRHLPRRRRILVGAVAFIITLALCVSVELITR